jgi:hypothetical protein
VKKRINQIRIENKFSLMAAIAAERLLSHVANGGWLGASADHYCFGIKDNAGQIISSGFDIFTDEQRKEAVLIAEAINPNLWQDAEDNFRTEAEADSPEEAHQKVFDDSVSESLSEVSRELSDQRDIQVLIDPIDDGDDVDYDNDNCPYCGREPNEYGGGCRWTDCPSNTLYQCTSCGSQEYGSYCVNYECRDCGGHMSWHSS